MPIFSLSADKLEKLTPPEPSKCKALYNDVLVAPWPTKRMVVCSLLTESLKNCRRRYCGWTGATVCLLINNCAPVFWAVTDFADSLNVNIAPAPVARTKNPWPLAIIFETNEALPTLPVFEVKEPKVLVIGSRTYMVALPTAPWRFAPKI